MTNRERLVRLARTCVRVVVAQAATVLLLMAVAMARAEPPTLASGTLAPGGPPTVTGIWTADGNTIITQRIPLILTGTFAGTAILDERVVLHADGLSTFEAWQTFTGTVNGRPGTVVLRIVGSGDATSLQGQFIVIRGTEELAALHGQGTFTLSAQTSSGIYTGQIQLP